MACNLPPVPDISGPGVRAAIYAQNLYCFYPAMRTIWDGKVTVDELSAVQRLLTTNLIIAFAILISAVVQASTLGLPNLHATIVLGQSWMNNTSFSIYFVLYVHHLSGGKQKHSLGWWARHLLRGEKGAGNGDDESINVKLFGVSIDRWPFVANIVYWIFGRPVLILGTLHLSFMASVGLWLWQNPRTFGLPAATCAIDVASIGIFGYQIPFRSKILRLVSITFYSIFLLPILNMVIPASFFLFAYFGVQARWHPARAPRQQPQRRISNTTSQLPEWSHNLRDNPEVIVVFICLVVLFAINIIFIIDIELTLRHNKPLLDFEESQMAFGQILALLLLAMPFRDSQVFGVIRRRQEGQTRDLRRAIRREERDEFLRLIKSGADVNTRTRSGRISALDVCFKFKDWALAENLVANHRATVKDPLVDSGRKPLQVAVEQAPPKFVQVLLQGGAQPDVEVIQAAAALGKLEVVGMLCHWFSDISPFFRKANFNTALGIRYLQSYDRSQKQDDLDKAIIHFATAVHGLAPSPLYRPQYINLGVAHRIRFNITKEKSDLDSAINNLEMAFKLTPYNLDQDPQLMAHLGRVYQTRINQHFRRPTLDHLRKSIEFLDAAVFFTSSSDPHLPEYLKDLAYSHQLWCEHLPEHGAVVLHLQEVVRLRREAVEYAKNRSDLERAEFIWDVGLAYEALFQHTSSLQDIKNAIAQFQAAIEVSPKQAESFEKLWDLASAYKSCFGYSKEISDLKNSIQQMRNAVKYAQPGHPSLPATLHALAVGYRDCFQQSGDLFDSRECIAWFEKAHSAGHDGGHSLNYTLGLAYQERFVRSLVVEDIDKAIEYFRSDTTPEHSTPPVLLVKLGRAHFSRFELEKELHDIELAVSYLKDAVYHTRADDPKLPLRLNSLALAYRSQYIFTGKTMHLFSALNIYAEIEDSTPNDHESLPDFLSNFGIALKDAFVITNRKPYLEDAIEKSEKAVMLMQSGTPEGTTDFPSYYIIPNRLGNAYLRRFAHFGDPVDLDKAIQFFQKALNTKVGGSSGYYDERDRAQAFNNLGNALRYRFEHRGRPQDIDESIRYLKTALESDRDAPVWNNNIGVAYRCRFESQGDREDINLAIVHFENAVERTPKGANRRWKWLNNLGKAFLSRCRDDEDIEKAIEFCRLAVENTSNKHAEYPKRLLSLAYALLCRAEKGSIEENNARDLERAMQLCKEAVHLTSAKHVEGPEMLSGLGSAYKLTYFHTDRMSDIDEAVQCFQVAVELTKQSPKLPSRLTQLADALELRYFVKMGQDVEDLEKAILHRHSAQVPLASSSQSHRWSVLPPKLATVFENFKKHCQTRSSDPTTS